MSRARRTAWAVRFAGASGPGPCYRLLASSRMNATAEAERLGYVDYQDIVPWAVRFTRPRPERRGGA